MTAMQASDRPIPSTPCAIGRRWLIVGLPAVAIGLALGLRLWNLNGRPFWYDEIGSLFFARLPLANLLTATAADTMPPLYYLLLEPALTIWPTIAGARGVSLVFGLVAAALAYQLARLAVGNKLAGLAALLVAVNPFLVYHSQEARMYSVLLAAQTAAAVALLLALRSDGTRWWLAFGAAELAAFWTHNAAFLHLATADVLLAWLWLRSRRLTPGTFASGSNRSLAPTGPLLANAVVLLGFLPWLLVLPEQLEKVARAFWIDRPGVVEVLRSQVVFLFNLPAPAPWLLFPDLALTVALLAIVGLVMRRERQSLPEAIPFLIVFWLGPIALAVLVSQVRPIFVERVVIGSVVPLVIVVGWALVELRPRPIGFGLLAILVASGIAGSVAQASYAGFPRAPWERVAAELRQASTADIAVVHDNKLSYFPAVYAAPEIAQSFLPDPAWSRSDTLAPATQRALGMVATPIEQAGGARSIAFVIFQQAIDEAVGQGRTPENLEWLRARFSERSVGEVGDLRIFRFERSR